jgi:hypothetical protein
MLRFSRNGFIIFNAVFVLIFLGVLKFQPWCDAARTAFFDCATLVPSGLMAVLGVLYARCKAKTSTGYVGWIFMGLAGAAYFIGQSIWTYYEVVLQIEAPLSQLGRCRLFSR